MERLFEERGLGLSSHSLNEVTSWSEGKPVTFREFIAVRGHPETRQAFGIEPTDNPLLKGVDELTDDERREMVCAQINQGSKDKGFPAGRKIYTPDELIKEVGLGTEVGRMITEALIKDTRLVQNLAESGKLYPVENTNPTITLPSGRQIQL